MTAKRKRRESFGAVRKLPSGRYQASYVGADGHRYTAPMTYDSQTDARDWLAAKRIELASGDWSPHEAMATKAAKAGQGDTFTEYAESWIATRTNRRGEHLRPRTAAEYRRLVAGPLATFGDSRLAGITPAGVRSWYSAQVKSGTQTQTARAYELLKAILSTAVDDGRLKSNPCQVRGGASASTGKKVEPPTVAELLHIADAIAPRYRAAVILAAWAGVRYGELTELRRKDIECSEQGGEVSIVAVNVTRAVVYVSPAPEDLPPRSKFCGCRPGCIIGPTKSDAGVRTVILPPHVNDVIVQHLDKFAGRFPESLLFTAADGVGHLPQSAFYKHWDAARKAAGRADMPWHALRHYGATRAALAGATIKELQARLGHSTVQAAMRYQHTAGRDEELAKRMSELA